jgi:transcriptional regulator with XRE-family HTH domain
MISLQQVMAIRQLFAQGISQRKIARETGISRGTISAIVNGRRPDYPDRIEELPRASGPPARCPECGGLVYLPCRLCFVRSQTRIGQVDSRSLQNQELHQAVVALLTFLQQPSTNESREPYSVRSSTGSGDTTPNEKPPGP